MRRNVRKRTALYWASLVAILSFFIGSVIYLTTITPSILGDGHEYVMQTVAFQNHFSFGISPEDFEETKSQFYRDQEGLYNTYTDPKCIAFDDRGWAYSNHFGAYSAMVTVIKLVLLKMDIYPLWAFSITNLILWTAALLVVFFFLKVDDKRKFCILILLIMNPAFYYLDWAHTEIYIFAFEVIGLVFLYSKQYIPSILAFSIAAMQNVGILPIAAMAGIYYILDCYDRYAGESKERNIFKFIAAYWKKIIPYGFLYLPAFLPIIVSYCRFGTFNRVADIAMENRYLFHKTVGYLFDPNLGIFPYEPLILIMFIALIIWGFKKYPKDAILNLLGVAGILFIITRQKQINSGMHGIMRYCVWIIPVLIFFVVFHWPSATGKRGGLLIAAIGESVFTAALVSYCVWFGGSYNGLRFSDWTETLIDVAPQIYNPTHTIFYSRTLGVELYDSPVPVVYENKQGYVRKILLSKTAETQFFDPSFVLIDEGEKNQIDKSALRGHPVDEGDYTYYNFNGKVRWLRGGLEGIALGDTSDTIYFCSQSYNADTFVRKGISIKEDWGSWTDGQEVVLCFALADASVSDVGIYIDVVDTFYHPQSVTALINGIEVCQKTVEGGMDIEFTFENPGTDIIELTLLLPDAVSSSETVDLDDSRELGLGLLKMKVTY